MEPLIISVGILLIGAVILMPLDRLAYGNNLHKLILLLNDRENYNTNNNVKTFKERLYILSEKVYRKFNINISGEKYDAYRTKLILAGLNDKLSVECILGSKILISILVVFYFGLAALINTSATNCMLLIVGTALAFFLPDSLVNIRIKKRQEELKKQLPSTLKTLAITTEAGMSFWEAVKKVCEVKTGVLIDELRKTLDEVSMGVLHREALMKLSERCKVPEITMFTFTIVQSLEKGASGVTKALNEQADEVWEMRKSRAKELGQKASIKLFLSMLVFVFPCLLIFLLGPAIMSIMKYFVNS